MYFMASLSWSWRRPAASLTRDVGTAGRFRTRSAKKLSAITPARWPEPELSAARHRVRRTAAPTGPAWRRAGVRADVAAPDASGIRSDAARPAQDCGRRPASLADRHESTTDIGRTHEEQSAGVGWRSRARV